MYNQQTSTTLDHCSPISSSALTPEQLERIRTNRARAIELRRQRTEELQSPTTSLVTNSDKPCVEISAKMAIINDRRFSVQFSRYNAITIASCRRISSGSYDPSNYSWNFHIDDYRVLVRALSELPNVSVTIDDGGIPDWVLKIFTTPSQTIKKAPPVDIGNGAIDAELVTQLFPFQRIGIQFGIEKGGRVLIADEMGLGKTVQALGIASYYRSEWPLIIVCPSSVKFTWKTQIAKFLPSIADSVHVIEKSSDCLPTTQTSQTVVIISYDLMAATVNRLINRHFNDESHMLKDAKTKRGQAAALLAEKSRRVILLSGTPALSRPRELFSQIRMINKKLFTNFRSFATRYCAAFHGRYGYDTSGVSNSQELGSILEKTLMIRRLKKDVLADLPEKRRVIVKLTGDVIKERLTSLRSARHACFAATDQSINRERLIEYYSETGMAKASSVATHILDEYFYDKDAPKRKILIFCHHRAVMDELTTTMEKKNIKMIRIDGMTPAREREHACMRFQEQEDVLVAILSITAANTGITLTAASVVVFAELHWNPGTLMQAEDRAHRVGQTDSVYVQYCVAPGTADDTLWPMIQRKLNVLNSIKLSSDSYADAEKQEVFDDRLQKLITDCFRNLDTINKDGAMSAVDADEPDRKRSRDSYI